MMTDAEITAIAQGVLDRCLPKAKWTHEAHFAAALWLLRHVETFDMASIIRAYNEATSTPNTDSGGYHESITRASLAIARQALAAAPEQPLSVILAQLMAGPHGRSDWPLTHWRRETLFSVAARRNWIAPDLAPLSGV